MKRRTNQQHKLRQQKQAPILVFPTAFLLQLGMKRHWFWFGLGLVGLGTAAVAQQKFLPLPFAPNAQDGEPPFPRGLHTPFTPSAPATVEHVTPATDANQALWDAVKANNPAQVQAAFAAGADPNAGVVSELQDPPESRPSSPPVPLLSTVACNDATPQDRKKAIAIFHMFLAQGVNVAARDSIGMTAIHRAVSLNDLTLVRAVLDKGGDPNATYKIGNHGGNALFTASMMALRGHEAELVPLYELLLSHGTDPNISLGDLTPLHHAALLGQAPLVAVLLKYHADPSRLTRPGSLSHLPFPSTALMLAERTGDPETIRLLRLAARNRKG